MRVAEWTYLSYFYYVALLALFRAPRAITQSALIAVSLSLILFIFSRLALRSRNFERARDWLPIAYTFIAYREMDWFSPLVRDHQLDNRWILTDRRLLDGGLRSAIEIAGPVLPGILEIAYLLVYGVTAFSIACFYFSKRRDRIDRFTTVYATGTLLAYALFPFFPSDPPRAVFPGQDLPGVMSPFRQWNLFFVGSLGIHSSVFPSAHVSSAFAAAYGLIRFLPERPGFGKGMWFYALVVAVATVYGRYHYATDALAGFATSLVALAVGQILPAPKVPLPERPIPPALSV